MSARQDCHAIKSREHHNRVGKQVHRGIHGVGRGELLRPIKRRRDFATSTRPPASASVRRAAVLRAATTQRLDPKHGKYCHGIDSPDEQRRDPEAPVTWRVADGRVIQEVHHLRDEAGADRADPECGKLNSHGSSSREPQRGRNSANRREHHE